MIYSRISADKEGDAAGVSRQEDDCRQLAERLGYEVVGIYRDNDTSASTRSTKPRPRYDAMMQAARSGEFAAILSYSNSRLTRRPREFEDLIDLYEHHGVQIHTVASGSFDLSTADGRRMARFLAGEATAEAERTSERVRRAKAENARNGEYRGGPRPFGYEEKGMVIRESEARIIREATDAVLAGRTLASICRDLNERGVPPASVKRVDRDLKKRPPQWKYNNLRDMLIRPRNAGILAHGLPNRNSSTNNHTKTYEEVRRAAWPAIVPEEKWRALVAVLTEPSRRMNQNSDTRWLGAGIYRCGRVMEDGQECGSVLRTAPHGGTHSRQGERRMLYRCVAHAHLTISQRETDEHVLSFVADLVGDPRVVDRLSPAEVDLSPDKEARQVLAARLIRTERDYDDDLIDARRYREKRDKLNAEIAEVDARISKAVRRSASSPIFAAADVGQAFLDAPIDIKRAVLASVVRVTIVPQIGGRGRAWSSDRVRLSPIDSSASVEGDAA